MAIGGKWEAAQIVDADPSAGGLSAVELSRRERPGGRKVTIGNGDRMCHGAARR